MTLLTLCSIRQFFGFREANQQNQTVDISPVTFPNSLCQTFHKAILSISYTGPSSQLYLCLTNQGFSNKSRWESHPRLTTSHFAGSFTCSSLLKSKPRCLMAVINFLPSCCNVSPTVAWYEVTSGQGVPYPVRSSKGRLQGLWNAVNNLK